MDASIAASRALGKSYSYGNCDPGFLYIPNDLGEYGVCIFKTIPSLYLLYIFSWGITAVVEIYFIHCIKEDQDCVGNMQAECKEKFRNGRNPNFETVKCFIKGSSRKCRFRGLFV